MNQETMSQSGRVAGSRCSARVGRWSAAAALSSAALLLLAGCSSVPEASEVSESTTTQQEVERPSAQNSDSAASEGKESTPPVTGSKSQQEIIQEIEKDFGDEKTTFHWNGNVLTMELDGDAADRNAGGAECGKLEHIVKAGTEIIMKFPNGEINCNTVITD